MPWPSLRESIASSQNHKPKSEQTSMKPLTYWIPFQISPELETELYALSPEQKIDNGRQFVELARNGLQYPVNVVIHDPNESELNGLSPENLARLGSALIIRGVDECDWGAL
jgi:hypothetical protein